MVQRDHNESCDDLLEESKEQRRREILAAALSSAENWAPAATAVSITSIVIEVAMLVLVFRLRRYRLIQVAGVGYLNYLLVACIFGHTVSLVDGAPPSGTVCRLRFSLIYIFLFGLLAPLIGRLYSLSFKSRNALMAEDAIAWDRRAVKVAAVIMSL